MRKFAALTLFFVIIISSNFADDNIPLAVSSADAAIENNYALGIFGDYYVTGIGLNSQVNIDIIPVPSLGCFVELDYIFGVSKTIWVDSFQDLYLSVGVSYELPPLGPVTVVPELSYGLLGHIVPGDIDRNGAAGTAFFLDQMLAIGAKILYPLTDSLLIFLNPEFTFLPESGFGGFLPGYDIGIRVEL